jgi:hypothetical protein
MTEFLVGEYQLGYRPVRVYADPDDNGGRVEFIPKDKQATKIVIGCDDTWPETFSVLLHEAYECVLSEAGFRYRASPTYSSAASEFLFILSHNQLDEAHTRVAYFLDDVIKPLRLVYDDIQEKKKKQREKAIKKK